MNPTTEVQMPIDKRTKEYKQSIQQNQIKGSGPVLGQLLAGGIEISRAVFNPSILSYGSDPNGSPETALFNSTPKAQKKANMWLCPGGILVIEQKGRYKVSNAWTELDVL